MLDLSQQELINPFNIDEVITLKSTDRRLKMESTHYFHLFIVCLAVFIERILAQGEGDLRLVNGTYSGRLEIYYNSTWMTISNKTLRGFSSRVACRQLGLPFTEADFVRDKRNLTPSDSEKVLVTWMVCQGDEDRLTECDRFGWNPVPFHTHDEDLAILCKGEFIPTGVLRLADGSDHRRGRLELYSGLRWTPLCRAGFQGPEAVVACRQLGFNTSQPYIYNDDYFGPPSGPYSSSLYIAQCTGDEEDIPSCDELYIAYPEECSVTEGSVSICCSQEPDSCNPDPVEVGDGETPGEIAGSLIALVLFSMALCAGFCITCKKPCCRCKKKPKPHQHYNAVSLTVASGGQNQYPEVASSTDQKLPVYIHTKADGTPATSGDPPASSPPAPVAGNTPYPLQTNPYPSGQDPPTAGAYPAPPPLQPGYNPTAATDTYPPPPYSAPAAPTGPANGSSSAEQPYPTKGGVNHSLPSHTASGTLCTPPMDLNSGQGEIPSAPPPY
ncbi:scavenger receptor cysteine-rich type 1 protein M130-like [Lytechinus variegatus]|uniref:scavenger receptor cysteine-rich type 1 protein M130-like n=1 Tax=Lytechinus variegatus TaxID=7654 RepID=UPI001BB2C643|nr:scavenger receptor cysteine-rich type 1 protein M130-like [Lytechinus variegatus]